MGTHSASRWRTSFSRRAAVIAGVASAAAGGLWWWRFGSRPLDGLGARVLLADVDNPTGDDALGAALGAGLAVSLAQSHHFDLVPDDRIAAELVRAGRPRHATLDLPVATAIAAGLGAVVIVAPRLRRSGERYTIGAELIDLRTQDRRSVGGAGPIARDGLLDALDRTAADVRAGLGEPRARIADASVLARLAASPSLDALAAYGATLRLGVNDKDRATELLQRALSLDADFALAMAALAALHYQFTDRDRRREGERLFAAALARPQRLTARHRLWLVALADDNAGRREAAAAGYRAFIAQHPNDTTAWFRLGWTTMAGLKQANAAVEAFERVTRLDPGHAGAWINLATSHAAARRDAQAVQTYHRAFELAPDFRLALHVNGEYGAALVRSGRLDDARAAFVAMKGAPDPLRRARGCRSMAFLLMHEGRYRAAIAELDEALRINTDPQQRLSVFRDRLIRAIALAAFGASDELAVALRELDAAIDELAPGPVWLARVAALHARAGASAAVARLVARLAGVVGDGRTHTEISRSLSEDQGFLDLAKCELERLAGRAHAAVAHAEAAAVRLDPAMVLAAWARALHGAGRLHDAAAKYRQLVELAPFGYEEQEEAARAAVALGGIEEALGRPDEARAIYRRLEAQWREGDAELLLRRQVIDRLQALAG